MALHFTRLMDKALALYVSDKKASDPPSNPVKCSAIAGQLWSILRALRLISAESERERKKGRSQGDWTTMCIKGLEVNKCIESSESIEINKCRERAEKKERKEEVRVTGLQCA